MLKVDGVCVKRGRVLTLEDISFTLPAGRTLAVVGESGAGKSTLISAVLGLVRLTGGSISWCDDAVRLCRPSLVLQEPRAAFNPALSIRQTILEPIVASGIKLAQGSLENLCSQLELPVNLLERRPGEISIGQAQRAGIIRALIATPSLVLFDEPLSALDAVTQKTTAQLIANLQAEQGFAALIVTHDLGFAAAFSDEIVVLRAGRVEEVAKSADFVRAPSTDYGCTLRNAAVALGALEHTV